MIAGGLLVTALLLIPQAFVSNIWQLLALRFLMGMSLAGLLPSISATIRHNVPDRVAGTILGYSTSAQYAGQVIGPMLGGFIGGHFRHARGVHGDDGADAAGCGLYLGAGGRPGPPLAERL